MKAPAIHQYIERESGAVRTETLYGDRIINAIWSEARENPSRLFKAMSSARMSGLLGFLNYDRVLGARLGGTHAFGEKLGIDFSECLDPPERMDTPRKLFERRIRYWRTRPMDDDPAVVVSPADAKVLLGSLATDSALFIKGKFFCFEELLGRDKLEWLDIFSGGDYALFRLTPEKYHYNHCPVAGIVSDIYEISGQYHPCNPGAVMTLATPFSKNKRVVTIIDTDVDGGTGVGKVAFIEVVALMIGAIVQCYSHERYRDPRPVAPGMFLRKGAPKSLYRPGSSTDIVLFEPHRVRFWPDLLRNQHRRDLRTRFSQGLGRPLAETELALRSPIAKRRNPS